MNNTTTSYKRSMFTTQRRQLTFAQRRRLANRAARKLTHRFLSRRCQHIGIYLDDFGELPTMSVFLWAKKHGKTIYLPVVVGKQLQFRKVDYQHLNTNRFALHRLGMKEPKTGKRVSVDQLDVLFLPLVAADTQGNRMGMGGGFYDRTLAKQAQRKQPYRVGWAYDFQVVNHLQPNAWDVPLHALITPQKRYVFHTP